MRTCKELHDFVNETWGPELIRARIVNSSSTSEESSIGIPHDRLVLYICHRGHVMVGGSFRENTASLERLDQKALELALQQIEEYCYSYNGSLTRDDYNDIESKLREFMGYS